METPASDKPFRDRVEVLALDDEGRVFGSLYPSGGFGGYGGGVEDGETPVQAAEREFLEEAGLNISNVRLLDIPPVEIEWGEGDKAGTDEKKSRRLKYRGSRTVYAVADLGAKAEGVKRERDKHGRRKGTLFSLDDAIASLDDEEGSEFAAVNAARKKALRQLKKAEMPSAVTKLAAVVRPIPPKMPAALAKATAKPAGKGWGRLALFGGLGTSAAGLGAAAMTGGGPPDFTGPTAPPVPNALDRTLKSVVDRLPTRLSGP